MFNIVVAEITDVCNFRCKYCYENSISSRHHYLGIDSFIDFLDNSGNMFKECAISGGEPFMHPQWYMFVDELIRRKRHVNIITNGSFIHQFIKQKRPITTMTISVDSFFNHLNQLRSPKLLCTKEDIIYLVKSYLVEKTYIQLILNRISAVKENIVDILHFCNLYSIGLKIRIMDNYVYNDTSEYQLTLEEICEIQQVITQYSKGIDIEIDMPPKEGNEFCNCSILNGSPNLRIRSDGHIFACEKANDEMLSLGVLNQPRDDYFNKMNLLRTKLTARIINMSTKDCQKCIYNKSCNKGCPVLMTSPDNNKRCIIGRA